jgi:hypothetical protein
MCVQCTMGATTAAASVGGAAGLRAWLAAQRFSWMTPRRLRVTTIALLGLGLLGASVGIGGG